MGRRRPRLAAIAAVSGSSRRNVTAPPRARACPSTDRDCALNRKSESPNGTTETPTESPRPTQAAATPIGDGLWPQTLSTEAPTIAATAVSTAACARMAAVRADATRTACSDASSSKAANIETVRRTTSTRGRAIPQRAAPPHRRRRSARTVVSSQRNDRLA